MSHGSGHHEYRRLGMVGCPGGTGTLLRPHDFPAMYSQAGNGPLVVPLVMRPRTSDCCGGWHK